MASFRVGFQPGHPVKTHHTVLVLRRQPVLVIVIEKNIAIAEPLFGHDRRAVHGLLMEYVGFSFDFPVELRQAHNYGGVEYE